MSDSLDERLRELIGSVHHEEVSGIQRESSINNVIAQIHEAFKAEGWVQLKDVGKTERVVAFTPDYMTGQEWFAAFEKEMGASSECECHECTYAMEAAKKAAGL